MIIIWKNVLPQLPGIKLYPRYPSQHVFAIKRLRSLSKRRSAPRTREPEKTRKQ